MSLAVHDVREDAVMKIHVNRIPPEGLRDRAVYDPATMELDREDIHLREPFAVEALITKAHHDLVVDVDIRCPARLSCAKCLEEFATMFTAEAIFTYTVRPTDVVDITEDVRQEIILAYPMIPICRPDCKGLCRICGQDLNAASCPHQHGA
ncbi:MAG: DUF177 domain-containing protein [Candidatus Omnitrophica bacterium]|nr:DUF177 domain-containing protein [Candidatus Omnitrophota bacterium]